MSDETSRALQRELDAALAEVLEPGSEVAYVNFPNIGNLGDSAIFAGSAASLRRADVRIAVTFEHRGYRPAAIRRALGDRATIVIQGGGNFGDLYAKAPQHRVRRRLLSDFPRARLVQLPQTIHFANAKRGRRFAERCAAHPDFTLMVRDRASVDWADSHGLRGILCPDGAFGLGRLRRPAEPSRAVTWIMREDVERRASSLAGGHDWPTGVVQRRGDCGRDLARRLARVERWERVAKRSPGRLGTWIARRAGNRFESIADLRLELALRQIAEGETLVTDRFHGHLLACLMGIPNVLLDNSYGKNRGLYEAFTHRYEIARFAETPEAAAELVSSLGR